MIFESKRKRRILPSLELMLGAHYGSYNVKKPKSKRYNFSFGLFFALQ